MKTKHNLKELHNFIELISDLVFVKNFNGQYTHCNKNFLDFFDKKREDVIFKTDYDLFSKENADLFRKSDTEIFKTKEDRFNYKEQIIHKNGITSYFTASKQILYDLNDNEVGLFCIIKDVTIEKEYELIYKDNKLLLEYIAIENNLKKILDKIVLLAEHRNKESTCSILLLDKEKKHLLTFSAPNLPSFFNIAIHGIKIGEKIGSCGSAAYKKKRVIVENINTHENWQDYLELTKKANLHSCWSEPIISSSNEILGTFAIYNDRPKKPSDFELKFISAYSNLAATAIEKDKNYKIILENEYELSLLFDNAQSGLIYVNNKMEILKVNKRFINIFGYETTKELIGSNILKLHLSKDNYNKIKKNTFLLLKAQETFYIECQFKKKDGTIIYCELSGKTLNKQYVNKLSKGILWTINDITKRKEDLQKVENLNKLATSLTQSQATLLSIFDKGDSVLFKWKNNPTWDVEYVSSSVSKLLGYSKEDFLSKRITYTHCIHKDDIKDVTNQANYAKENNLSHFKYEPYRIIDKNNKIKWILEHSVIQRDTSNNILYFIGYITDITEQLKQQEIIFQQSKLVSMGEMIGNIAHQWRQPLSIISSIATASKLEKQLNTLDEKVFLKNMEIINTNAQYLSHTIDDFREFIKADRELNDFNLSSTIKSFLNVVETSVTKNTIQVILDLEDDIIMNNYQNDMIQSFINIINNSIDAFLEKNIKERYFFITTKKLGKKIYIKLKDNAGGINKDLLNKVFEPYTTSKHKSKGTGLGLNITYNFIVLGMKGNISVNNTTYIYKNKELLGCEFLVTFDN